MRNAHIMPAASSLAVILLLAGCQASNDSDETNPTITSSEESADVDLYSKEVSAEDVCPEAVELEALPTGITFTTGVESESWSAEDDPWISCEYGIYLTNPEPDPLVQGFTQYVKVSEDYVAMRVTIRIGDEAVTGNPNMHLEYSSLSYFDDWALTGQEYSEDEGSGSCVYKPEGLLTFELFDYCPSGADNMISSDLALVVANQNLEMSFDGRFVRTGTLAGDGGGEALGAVMAELAELAVARVPLADD